MSYLKNLWQAAQEEATLLNADRLLNALCAGNPIITISGRVGYFSANKHSIYWEVLEWAINQTFHPLDGPAHCHKAWQWEMHNVKPKGSYRRGNDIALGLLSIFVLAGCLPLSLIVFGIAKYKELAR